MIVIGLSHRTAPIDIRERLAIPPDELESFAQMLTSVDPIGETVVLSTCNRVEIYAAAANGGDDAAVLDALTRRLAEVGGREVTPHLMQADGIDAVRHLFRVASSLDSLVVGEPQILGQLKDAIRVAVSANTIGSELSAAMRSALNVAKKVRTRTAIGAGQVSIPSVAVDLARQIFADLSNHTALLVGAGEMAETAAKLLARQGAALLVVNRSLERAEKLATKVGGRPRSWDDLEASLAEADIVITSPASPQHVVSKKQIKGLSRKRRGRSLFLIDIAVPRDVDPAVNDVENVYLYDIDDLSHVVTQSLEGRAQEARIAEDMVDKEARSFEERRSQQAMKPLIVALRQRTQAVLTEELSRTRKGRLKHLNDKDHKALQKMLDAAVNKLLHAPTTRLKQLATTPQSDDVVNLLCHLFELDEALEELSSQEVHISQHPELVAADESEEEDEEPVSERRPVALR